MKNFFMDFFNCFFLGEDYIAAKKAEEEGEELSHIRYEDRDRFATRVYNNIEDYR